MGEGVDDRVENTQNKNEIKINLTIQEKERYR